MLRHEALRIVEVPGSPDEVWLLVQECAPQLGRVGHSVPAHRSLLLHVRRRLGSVDVGIHVVGVARSGRAKVEVAAVGTGLTDALVVAAAEAVGARLRERAAQRV